MWWPTPWWCKKIIRTQRPSSDGGCCEACEGASCAQGGQGCQEQEGCEDQEEGRRREAEGQQPQGAPPCGIAAMHATRAVHPEHPIHAPPWRPPRKTSDGMRRLRRLDSLVPRSRRGRCATVVRERGSTTRMLANPNADEGVGGGRRSSSTPRCAPRRGGWSRRRRSNAACTCR